MSSETKNWKLFRILRCQIRIEMRCDTVNVAGSGKLEKRRQISIDPEIQTKIEGHKNADGRCQKGRTYMVWYLPFIFVE